MAAPHIVRYESAEALRSAATSWDDLWERSEGALPTARADFIADWLEQLAPDAKFVAVTVERDGQLVAALPLVERRVARVVACGSLPWTPWSWAGDLLVDLAADTPQALSSLLAEVRRLSWPALWFDTVPLKSAPWRQMLAALDASGMGHGQHERFRIGRVEIAEQLARDWKAYESAWSGNHRRHMRKALRRAEEEGGVELDVRCPQSAGELEALLREGFEVEHRSWKGREGTSVVACPLMWNFYLRQATRLAEPGQLELTFLRHNGRAIAFEYGWVVRGTYCTPKVGYDDAYGRFSPGQLLRLLLLEDCFGREDRWAVDFMGPLSEATAKWATRTYPISRLVVDTGKLRGKALLWTYRNAFSPIRSAWRRKHGPRELSIVDVPPGAESPLPVVADKV